MSLPTAYTRLCEHHAKHIFKRGANQGAAPLESRRKTNRLVRITPTHADVILYRTTVLRAFPDGRVALSTGGYNTNSTREVLNLALRFLSPRAAVYSQKRFSLSQLHYYTPTGTYAFYDGMTLTPDGIPADPMPFQRKMLDPTQTKPFNAEAKGFRQMFPILHAALPDIQTDSDHANATRQAYQAARLYNSDALRESIASKPDLWPVIVHSNAYFSQWVSGSWRDRKLEPKAVLARILHQVKRNMYVIVPTEVTCLLPASK